MDPIFISVTEAAERLGIGRSLAYRLVEEERLPSVTLGKRRMVPAAALVEWAARVTAGGVDALLSNGAGTRHSKRSREMVGSRGRA